MRNFEEEISADYDVELNELFEKLYETLGVHSLPEIRGMVLSSLKEGKTVTEIAGDIIAYSGSEVTDDEPVVRTVEEIAQIVEK